MKFLVLIFLYLDLILVQRGLASESIDEYQALEIAHELRCPMCQGLSVKESSTAISENMKTQIRKMLRERESKEEIMLFFENRYGEWIRRTPKMSGFNLLLWIVPAVLVTGGFIFIFFLAKKWTLYDKKGESEHKPQLQRYEINKEFEKITRSK